MNPVVKITRRAEAPRTETKLTGAGISLWEAIGRSSGNIFCRHSLDRDHTIEVIVEFCVAVIRRWFLLSRRDLLIVRLRPGHDLAQFRAMLAARLKLNVPAADASKYLIVEHNRADEDLPARILSLMKNTEVTEVRLLVDVGQGSSVAVAERPEWLLERARSLHSIPTHDASMAHREIDLKELIDGTFGNDVDFGSTVRDARGPFISCVSIWNTDDVLSLSSAQQLNLSRSHDLFFKWSSAGHWNPVDPLVAVGQPIPDPRIRLVSPATERRAPAYSPRTLPQIVEHAILEECNDVPPWYTELHAKLGGEDPVDAEQALWNVLTAPKPQLGLLLGDMGTGKSTLLHRLIHSPKVGPSQNQPLLIPIFDMQRHWNFDRFKKLGAREVALRLARAEVARLAGSARHPDALDEVMRERRVCFLFDKFDQSANPRQPKSLRLLCDTICELPLLGFPVIVASREASYEPSRVVAESLVQFTRRAGGKDRLKRYRLLPLNEDQRQKIVTGVVYDKVEHNPDAHIRVVNEWLQSTPESDLRTLPAWLVLTTTGIIRSGPLQPDRADPRSSVIDTMLFKPQDIKHAHRLRKALENVAAASFAWDRQFQGRKSLTDLRIAPLESQDIQMLEKMPFVERSGKGEPVPLRFWHEIVRQHFLAGFVRRKIGRGDVEILGFAPLFWALSTKLRWSLARADIHGLERALATVSEKERRKEDISFEGNAWHLILVRYLFSDEKPAAELVQVAERRYAECMTRFSSMSSASWQGSNLEALFSPLGAIREMSLFLDKFGNGSRRYSEDFVRIVRENQVACEVLVRVIVEYFGTAPDAIAHITNSHFKHGSRHRVMRSVDLLELLLIVQTRWSVTPEMRERVLARCPDILEVLAAMQQEASRLEYAGNSVDQELLNQLIPVLTERLREPTERG